MEKVVNIARVLTIRISLEGIEPAIWRSFVVREDISLHEFHEIIQTVMDWTDTHLYNFVIRNTEYTDEETAAELEGSKIADTVSLRSLKLKNGDTFKYLYDFGDGWMHKLKIEGVAAPETGIEYPVCLAGARSCPPEDCGGPPGYEEFLNIFNDPGHEEHESMREWAGPFFDPEDYDVELTNVLLHADPEDDDMFFDDVDDELSIEMQKISRKQMHTLWEAARNDRLDDLPDEDRELAKIMLDHEDEFFNNFEFADVLSEREFDTESEVNPFLHIALHSLVENQLRGKEPIEVYQFYNSMRKKKETHHDTIHLIITILMPLVFYLMEEKQPFDMDIYKTLLKNCKNKRPDRIPDYLDNEFGSYFGG